ncbi:hypothetical protein HK105_201969 [Polyrhizophydium stewartii]|uniref:Uncharacterized protein n=1 Tax=Polyrhizophydium stewartii TaxID=2732419 RepID=A0ABR4NGA5_9FUNG
MLFALPKTNLGGGEQLAEEVEEAEEAEEVEEVEEVEDMGTDRSVRSGKFKTRTHSQALPRLRAHMVYPHDPQA